MSPATRPGPSLLTRVHLTVTLFVLLGSNLNLYQYGLSLSDKDRVKLENLLDICCDFSDCILQVSENVVSHTLGGVLNIRLNDNWEKLSDGFQVVKEKLRTGDRYVRISLVDYSTQGLLEGIREKSGCETLTLKNVFKKQHQVEDRMDKVYQEYMDDADHVIHHYGLKVFHDVVLQYNGCFSLIGSSGTNVLAERSFHENSEYASCIEGKDRRGISGTEFDILLLLNEMTAKSISDTYTPSLILSPEMVNCLPARTEVFMPRKAEGVWDKLYDHFNEPLSKIVKQTSKEYDYQKAKEETVRKSAEALCDAIYSCGTDRHVFYFYISKKSDSIFGRVEIIAKILLKAIAELEKCGCHGVCLVVYGLTENRLVSFSRQFALFYHRERGNKTMRDSQIYAVSANYASEVLFAGSNLHIIADYCKSRQLVTGVSSRIMDMLDRIAQRDRSASKDGYDHIEPYPFDLLCRMEEMEDRDDARLSPQKKKWYHSNLERVLQNDIHGKNLGCCLSNTHVRAGCVHLRTFYEGQLLFANTYWYKIFAAYICEQILGDPEIKKDYRILLYGYETYSEQMLLAAEKQLERAGRKAEYAIFENPKYITVSETSPRRVRYIEHVAGRHREEKLCVVFIMGVATTRITFERDMLPQIKEAFEKTGNEEQLKCAYLKDIVIIQVGTENSGEKLSGARPVFRGAQGGANPPCLVRMDSEYQYPKDCKDCLPYNYLDERALIQTNETSTIPMILIKSTKRDDGRLGFYQEKAHTESFLGKPEKNAQYLYYSHLDRSGNHFQFYLRTASLMNRLLEEQDTDLMEWMREIRENEFPETKITELKDRIDIIVAPLHFSSETLTAAINDHVFGGSAYIINFDVKKEFRESFVAKFQNYRSGVKMLLGNGYRRNLEVNFYYVDDEVITGATLARAKSLVTSMMGDLDLPEDMVCRIKVNIFKALILFVNRNSRQTLCNFFERSQLKKNREGIRKLPVYRFLELYTPSIRSYGDSCPLCGKLERIHRLIRESSLTFVERHWREKAEYHGLKKLTDAKVDRETKNKVRRSNLSYATRGFRRLQCSEMVWKMLRENDISQKNGRENLEQTIQHYLNSLTEDRDKFEYLISFLKVISREHIIYQESIHDAALKILLTIFSLFVKDGKAPREGLYATVEDLLLRAESYEEGRGLRYELYRAVIARLCSMGSNLLLRKEQLLMCLKTGIQLQEAAKTDSDKEKFYVFLCIQIKKMLFITQDYEIRVEKMGEVIQKCIQNQQTQTDDSEFYYAMLLECVSDQIRSKYAKDMTGKDISKFDDYLKSAPYDDVLGRFMRIMGANNILMFQQKMGDLLDRGSGQEAVDPRDIILLAESSKHHEKTIPLLRSELLDFYCNWGQSEPQNPAKPGSELLLDIQDTVRIVSVKAEQDDTAVCAYSREPCVIAYVRIDYMDHLAKSGKHIFFAFVFNENLADVTVILKRIKMFLAFRYTIVSRLEKDFNGNLYGQRVEANWRSNMLANEKAGCHTNSSGISKIISNLKFNNEDIVRVLFSKEDSESVQDGETTGSGTGYRRSGREVEFKLIYNILIAMYYRTVVSTEDRSLIPTDNVSDGETCSYCALKSVLPFSKITSPELKYDEGWNGKRLEEMRVFGKTGTSVGIPVKKTISFRRKYLQAFLIDVLYNAKAHCQTGEGVQSEPVYITVEKREKGPWYLVIKNLCAEIGDSSVRDCLERNYRLKQAVELDYTTGQIVQWGISLGTASCFLHECGLMRARFTCEEGKTYFNVELPILANETES